MKINRKLSVIASLVPKGSNVIDIGADHALLDIFLTLYNDNHCIASDIKKSAIQGAFQNLKKYHLEDKVQLIVSDGFDKIPVRNHETVILSGMGTHTILKIMKNIPRDRIDQIIISSNNDLKELRYQMVKNNFKIVDEVVVNENNIFYVIIKFEKGSSSLTNRELQYGPCLLKQNTLERNIYYSNLIQKNNQIIQQLPSKELKKKYYLWKENLFLKRKLKKL